MTASIKPSSLEMLSTAAGVAGTAISIFGPAIVPGGSVIVLGTALSAASIAIDSYVDFQQYQSGKYKGDAARLGAAVLSDALSLASMGVSTRNMMQGFVQISKFERDFAIAANVTNMAYAVYAHDQEPVSVVQLIFQGAMVAFLGTSSAVRNPFRFESAKSLPKATIMVSHDSEHVLSSMMKARWWGKYGGLPIGQVEILSSHANAPTAEKLVTCATLAERYDVPYHWKAMGKMGSPERSAHMDWVKGHIERFEPQFVFLAKYMAQVREDVIKAAARTVDAETNPFGINIMNLHHGDVHAFKGRFPVTEAVASGSRFQVVTAHLITDNLDEGNIIAQRCFTIPVTEPWYHSEDLWEGVQKFMVPRVKQIEKEAWLEGAGLLLRARLAKIPNSNFGKAAASLEGKVPPYRIAPTGSSGVWIPLFT